MCTCNPITLIIRKGGLCFVLKLDFFFINARTNSLHYKTLFLRQTAFKTLFKRIQEKDLMGGGGNFNQDIYILITNSA